MANSSCYRYRRRPPKSLGQPWRPFRRGPSLDGRAERMTLGLKRQLPSVKAVPGFGAWGVRRYHRHSRYIPACTLSATVAILPEFQGRNLGLRLLQWMNTEARWRQARQLWLCVSTFNTRAPGLLSAFRLRGRRSFGQACQRRLGRTSNAEAPFLRRFTPPDFYCTSRTMRPRIFPSRTRLGRGLPPLSNYACVSCRQACPDPGLRRAATNASRRFAFGAMTESMPVRSTARRIKGAQRLSAGPFLAPNRKRRPLRHISSAPAHSPACGCPRRRPRPPAFAPSGLPGPESSCRAINSEAPRERR